MGDLNQRRFIERFSRECEGAYLEIGSRDYGTTQDLRSMFAGRGEYIGVDMYEGKGVDKVLDLTDDFEVIDEKLQGMRFGTIFCLSVFEHCERPFVMADNLTSLLNANGKIIVSAPFAWRFHGYPSDYWRFTHEGIKRLFPRLSFDVTRGVATSPSSPESAPLDKSIALIPFSFSEHYRNGKMLRGVSAKMFKLLSRIGIFRWLGGNRYVLAPTMITMIGQLRRE